MIRASAREVRNLRTFEAKSIPAAFSPFQKLVKKIDVDLTKLFLEYGRGHPDDLRAVVRLRQGPALTTP
jgi:hypothetical protein